MRKYPRKVNYPEIYVNQYKSFDSQWLHSYDFDFHSILRFQYLNLPSHTKNMQIIVGYLLEIFISLQTSKVASNLALPCKTLLICNFCYAIGKFSKND